MLIPFNDKRRSGEVRVAFLIDLAVLRNISSALLFLY